MKKKLMLFVVALMALVCIFAISAGAATTNEFGTIETIPDIDLTGMANDTTSRVVLQDGSEYHTYPSSYIVKDTAIFTLDFTKLNAATGKKYDMGKIIRLEVPKGVTQMSGEKDGGSCFKNNKSLVEVVLGNDVTTAGYRAFGWCTKLTTVTFGDNITTMASEAFNGTTTITDVHVSSVDKWLTIYFDNSNGSNPLQHPGAKLFANGALVEHVTIKNVSTVQKHAFYGYDYLKSVTIETTGALTFNTKCFADCTALETVTIPSVEYWISNVTVSGADASPFYSGPDAIYADGKLLTSLEITSTSAWGAYAFAGAKTITSVTIEEGVTSLPNGAFYGFGITEVKFPTTLKSISREAFIYCGSLVLTEIPTTITTIGNNAFEGCTSITEFTMPAHINVSNNFGTGVFKNTGLVNVVLPANFSQIKNNTFQNCTSLKTVVLPDTTTKIGSSAFSGCTSLVSIDTPETLTSIDQEAFLNCTSLKEFNFENITWIGLYGFKGCKSLKTAKFMATSVNLEKGRIFEDCSGLEFVYFNPNMTSFKMGGMMFWNCKSLKAISLPDCLETIYNYSFANCTNLEAVHLPNNLVYIHGNKSNDGAAFYNNPKMYFVQDQFSVLNEDGEFYSVEEYVSPAKPDVYYFPSTLKYIVANHNPNNSVWYNEATGMTVNGKGQEDIGIASCTNLNSILVFPEGFTGYADQASGNAILDENQRGDTLNSGMIQNCGTQSNPLTLVFLGRIDRVSMGRTGATQYVTYVFANSANTSFENTLVGTSSGTDYKNQNEMYVIFCKANGGAEKYKVSFKADSTDKNLPVLVAEKQTGEGVVTHISSPRDAMVTTNATCIANAYGTRYCFCGYEMGTDEIEGTATGVHIFEKDNDCTTAHNCTSDPNCVEKIEALSHEIYETLVYVSFVANGEYCYGCSNAGCTVIDVESTTKPIFVAGSGFSTKLSQNDGISGGYVVNIDELNEYNRVNAENQLTFGIMMVNPKYLAGKNSFFANGNVNAEKYLQVDMSNANYTNLNISITGFVGDARAISIIIALYAYVDGEEVEFIQSQTTQCANEKVTLGGDSLYTVTYESVANAAGKDLSNLGDYIFPTKEEE